MNETLEVGVFQTETSDQESDLRQRIAEACIRAKKLGPVHTHFEPDLLAGFGGLIATVEAIIGVVESGQPGIIVEPTHLGKKSLLVVQPQGQFDWRGFSGILLRVHFIEDKHSRMASLRRALPALSKEEWIHSSKEPRGQITTVNFGNSATHTAVYVNDELITLSYRTYNDSTSYHDLETIRSPKTGSWKSQYTPAYRDQATLLKPDQDPISFTRFPNDEKRIALRRRTSSEEFLTIEVAITERNGRTWLATMKAPLRFPQDLLPSIQFDEYLQWLKQNWHTAYPKLCQQEPVIMVTKQGLE